MTLDACATLVQRADPDRFMAVMAAPVAARKVLLPLFAFNIEVSRAPWVTKEPMIAEMRLQWWCDALAEIAGGGAVRSHEVINPLAEIVRGGNIDVVTLEKLVEARRWDIYNDPFEDHGQFDAYLEDTGGGLMWAAARGLGADEASETRIRGVGWALGLANFFRAVPELEARGKRPLADGRPEAVRVLAEEGLGRLGAARQTGYGAEVFALRTAWQAGPILRQAAAEPGRVAAGGLGLSEFRKRAGLLVLGLTGRW